MMMSIYYVIYGTKFTDNNNTGLDCLEEKTWNRTRVTYGIRLLF